MKNKAKSKTVDKVNGGIKIIKDDVIKPDKVRMSWPTYNFLKNLVEDCQKKLEIHWQHSLDFLPEEPYRSGRKTGREKAYEVFGKEWAALEKIKVELHNSIAEGYKDHPSKEMREFWGV